VQFDIHISIVQVRDGLEYEGTVEVGKASFDYSLEFAIPIPELDSSRYEESTAEIRNTFKITLKKEKVFIDLLDDEFFFFAQLIVEYALRFYNLPQTRDLNKKLRGVMKNAEAKLALQRATVILQEPILRMNSNVFCTIPIEICYMLNKVKFDCSLTS